MNTTNDTSLGVVQPNNPNIIDPATISPGDYPVLKACTARGLYPLTLSNNERYALRKIPVYRFSGRYTPFSPYFPVFREKHWEYTLRIINQLAKYGTLTRMIRDEDFKELFTVNFYKLGKILLSMGYTSNAKTKTLSDKTIKQVVRNIRLTCPAFHYWLKNKEEPAPPAVVTDAEELRWLSLCDSSSLDHELYPSYPKWEQIEGHGLTDVVSTVGTHFHGVAPYVVSTVSMAAATGMEDFYPAIAAGIGLYSLSHGISRLFPKMDSASMKARLTDIGEGFATGLGNKAFTLDAICNAASGITSGVLHGFKTSVSPIFQPLVDLFESIDKFCCDYVPLWARLPVLLRYVIMAFVAACTIYSLFSVGSVVSAAVSNILTDWMGVTTGPEEILGHSIAPIACATMLFSVLAQNYDATKGFNMFRSLYGTLKGLESDFNIESSFKKWTNKLFSCMGMDDVFSTATLVEEWDKVAAEFQEIEQIPSLDKEMVSDVTLPTRVRECTKALIEVEKAMRFCRQVPANYKSTAAATVLRAIRLTKEVMRKNSRFSDRAAPVWFDFRGPPGHGKTASGDMLLATIYFALHGRQMGPGDRCSKAPSSQYWNGYHEGVWAVVMQELCTCKVPEKNLNDVMFLLNAVGQDFCPLDMADVESKGTMGFCSPVIMSTGNGDYSQAPIQDIGALRRRIAFPLEVTRKQALPDKPNLEDFNQAWVFKPNDDWRNHPSEYKGVFKDLLPDSFQDFKNTTQTWTFTEIVLMGMKALSTNKSELAFTHFASDIVGELNIAPVGISGHAGADKPDVGILLSRRDDDDWLIVYDDIAYEIIEDKPFRLSPTEHLEVGDYQYARSVVPAQDISLMLDFPDQVHVVTPLMPYSPEGENSTDYVFTHTEFIGGTKSEVVVPASQCSYKSGLGNNNLVQWETLFELGGVGCVSNVRPGQLHANIPIRVLNEHGGSFEVVYYTFTDLWECLHLGNHIVTIEDNPIPFMVHAGFKNFHMEIYDTCLRHEDSSLVEWVAGPFMAGMTALQEWSSNLNVSQIITLSATVPLTISAFMSLRAALTRPNATEGQSDVKGKFDKYLDEDDLFARGKQRAKVYKFKASPKDRGHDPRAHHVPDDDDWYDLGIDGHSATDPTVLVSNMRKISVSGTNSVCWALLLDSNTLITVRHIFCSGGSLKLYTTSTPLRSTTYLPSQFDVVFCDESDLCMVIFRKPMISVKSIWRHIGDDFDVPAYTRRVTPIITKGLVTSVTSRESGLRVVDGSFVIKQVPEHLQYPITFYAQVDDPTTKLGDCGLPYLSNVGGSDKVIGIHFGGHRGVACMALFTASLLKTMKSEFATGEIKAEASPLASVTDTTILPNLPGADIVGIMDTSKVTLASQPPNRMHHTELQVQNNVQPPSWTTDAQPASLKGKVALKATDFLKRGNTAFDPLLEHILTRDDWLLDSINWEEFLRTPLEEPLSVKPRELLLGKPGKLNSVSDKTSIGPLFKRGIYKIGGKNVQSKKELWCVEDEYVNPEFLKMCVNRVKNTRKGILTPTVVEARYKQELRDADAKGITLGFKEGKEVFRGKLADMPPDDCDYVTRGLIPREFYVSCPIDNYEIRAFMWPYMERKHALTNCNACQVGTNPYSIDWKILNDRTNKFPNLICLDVKSCDKTVMRVMEPCFLRKLRKAYQCEIGSQTDIWLQTLVSKMFSYEAIVAGEIDNVPAEFVVTFSETVASGLWVTSEMDGDWVFFLYRTAFAYLKILEESDETWDDNVVIVTYGDDNVAAVSDKVAPWYNRISIANFAFEHYGVTLTSLRKIPVIHEKCPRPFDDRRDKEFLKRTFYKDKPSNAVLAPLEQASIWNSLIWTAHKPMEKSEAVEYYGQILQGALYETSLHGKHAFSQFVSYFKPKYRLLGGTWSQDWSYDKVRQSAIFRAKSTDATSSYKDYEQLLHLAPPEGCEDPYGDGLFDSVIVDASSAD